jgi:hypothetical protein
VISVVLPCVSLSVVEVVIPLTLSDASEELIVLELRAVSEGCSVVDCFVASERLVLVELFNFGVFAVAELLVLLETLPDIEWLEAVECFEVLALVFGFTSVVFDGMDDFELSPFGLVSVDVLTGCEVDSLSLSLLDGLGVVGVVVAFVNDFGDV